MTRQRTVTQAAPNAPNIERFFECTRGRINWHTLEHRGIQLKHNYSRARINCTQLPVFHHAPDAIGQIAVRARDNFAARRVEREHAIVATGDAVQ